MITTDELKAFAKAHGSDLLGVASMDRFEGAPPEMDPRRIFPDAQAVIVTARRIRRGHFRAMEEGTLWQTVARWHTDFDALIRFIERQGYECVPYAPLDAPHMPRHPVHNGLCAPNAVRLPLEYAAVAAGLGEIGHHGMFMTPEFGIRQALGLLITDMPLTPTQLNGYSICARCLDCVRHCPLQAISEKTLPVSVAGQTMQVAHINATACRVCPNGAAGDSSHFAGAEELPVVVEHNQDRASVRSRFLGDSLPNRLAAACGRACIAHFEGTRPTGYKIPFRIREPWGYRPDEPEVV